MPFIQFFYVSGGGHAVFCLCLKCSQMEKKFTASAIYFSVGVAARQSAGFFDYVAVADATFTALPMTSPKQRVIQRSAGVAKRPACSRSTSEMAEGTREVGGTGEPTN
jgi:hypothetical protein